MSNREEDKPYRNQDKNQNKVNITNKNQKEIYEDNQEEIKEENIFDFNDLKNEESDLPISNFNYINNLDFQNIGLSEIDKEKNELDDLFINLL